MSERQYSFNGLAGCVSQRRSRLTCHLVGVYHAEQAGLDDDPSCKWFTVCEHHNMLVGHSTLTLAQSHAADPTGWCEPCRSEVEAKHARS